MLYRRSPTRKSLLLPEPPFSTLTSSTAAKCLLSAEIWITVMKNDRKCKQFFFKKKRKKMLVFPKNAEKNASKIEKGVVTKGMKITR